MEDALTAFLLRLDLLPALADASRRPRLRVPEHVRVAPDELRVDGPGDGLEVALALLLEEEREEVDLEQEIAELVVERRGIARERRVGHLVRFLDRVRHDRAGGLLPVPRALGAQAERELA